MTISDMVPWILAVANFGLAIWVTIHAVLNKRDTRAAIGWTGLAWLAPFLGSLAYWCLGVNRIQRRGIRLGVQDALKERPTFRIEQIDIEQAEFAATVYPNIAALASVGRALTGRTVLPGNAITPLLDGDQTYPAMVDAIAQARHTIGLSSYIFDSDRAGDVLVDALAAAKARGIEIRVLIDDIGTRYSKVNMVKRLTENGITAASFLPTRIGRIPFFANLRNHRKILVVDGRIGFTGGTNIREAHWLALDPGYPTRCLHFRLDGPVVASLQEVFVTDWAFATGETLSGPAWFPELARAGDIWARGIAHGPDEDFETLSKVIFAAISSAREKLRIVTPYFLPDSRLIEALSVAALSGVRVEIYLPSNNNNAVVEWAATSQLDLILKHGCKVFVTPPPFDHTKLMIVDGVWALIGSTNWDPRSLRLNFEFNVECFDQAFVEALDAVIDAKAEGARVVTEEAVLARSFWTRLRDGLARLLSPYL